uniref:Uncharacterized protein n=1 Tax=Meloidogyne floridensis TaxID=298350 RepID=A0A915NL33_9BILA
MSTNNSPIKPQASRRLHASPSLVLRQQNKRKKEVEQQIQEENTHPSIFEGREFWADALKTLILKFKRIHPELVHKNKRRKKFKRKKKH